MYFKMIVILLHDRIAIDKLKSMDDAFREQLDKKEEGHQQALEQMVEEKQDEIDVANKRVGIIIPMSLKYL